MLSPGAKEPALPARFEPSDDVAAMVAEWLRNVPKAFSYTEEHLLEGLQSYGQLRADRVTLMRFLNSMPAESTFRRHHRQKFGDSGTARQVGRSVFAFARYFQRRHYQEDDPLVGELAYGALEIDRERAMVAAFLAAMARVGEGEGGDWRLARDRCLFELMYWCGLSVSEVLSTRRQTINLVNQTIRIFGRGVGHEKPVPFDALPALIQYMQVRPQSGDTHLFVGPDGRRLSRTQLYRILEMRLVQIGMLPILEAGAFCHARG